MARLSQTIPRKRKFTKLIKGHQRSVRDRSRCPICGRPRAFIRKFQLCRICFRQLAHQGELPGITKSSW